MQVLRHKQKHARVCVGDRGVSLDMDFAPDSSTTGYTAIRDRNNPWHVTVLALGVEFQHK